MQEKISKLIPEKEIQEKVEEIAKNIAKDYKDKVIFVTNLKGAKIFCSDLIKTIKKISDLKIENYFVKLSSYGDKTETSGEVKIEKDIEEDLEGKDILIIDDIVDTGITLSFLKEYLLKTKKAKSVKVCSLLDKPSRRKIEVKIDYKGFEVPDKFVVGYGIDYAEKYRELPYVAVLVEE